MFSRTISFFSQIQCTSYSNGFICLKWREFSFFPPSLGSLENCFSLLYTLSFIVSITLNPR